ncbi:hypothetical protein RBSWK_03959 [Rhodopirellula baltica SWK14]|uniref:Uncharacterized protein n=1 Tax=Rhodopirellula baltica SWK14 TaxID=993516 RepID=L7CEH3_RHOBT|nr:hypothetical protein RBSWK_03959 [Rhodopirellula baltica SWK14]
MAVWWYVLLSCAFRRLGLLFWGVRHEVSLLQKLFRGLFGGGVWLANGEHQPYVFV